VGVEPKLLRYSYYTAGSGGAGKTILETTFLLAGEEVNVFRWECNIIECYTEASPISY
jgi:hypothetical protein